MDIGDLRTGANLGCPTGTRTAKASHNLDPRGEPCTSDAARQLFCLLGTVYCRQDLHIFRHRLSSSSSTCGGRWRLVGRFWQTLKFFINLLKVFSMLLQLDVWLVFEYPIKSIILVLPHVIPPLCHKYTEREQPSNDKGDSKGLKDAVLQDKDYSNSKANHVKCNKERYDDLATDRTVYGKGPKSCPRGRRNGPVLSVKRLSGALQLLLELISLSPEIIHS